MRKAICGIDCEECQYKEGCKGCAATDGHPFGGSCVLARCCREKGCTSCEQCPSRCSLKDSFIREINALDLPGMKPVTELNALLGSYINQEYELPNGQKVKLLSDNDIYLGTQIEQPDGTHCFGVAVDERQILVSEYGAGGAAPRLVLFKQKKR